MSETDEESAAAAGRRRWVLAGTVAVVASIAVVVGLALFQPWKLWVDDTVNDAAPAGAIALTAPASTVNDPFPASPPSTVPPQATASAPTVTAPPTTATSPTTTTTPPAPPAPAGIDFAGIDHATTGQLVLLQDAAGSRFVRLENLDTSNGPDLFVYLSTNAPDGPEGRFDDDYVNLGRLQGNVGSSNYPIPGGTDLSRYTSVVIWCDRFNSAFGAAALS